MDHVQSWLSVKYVSVVVIFPVSSCLLVKIPVFVGLNPCFADLCRFNQHFCRLNTPHFGGSKISTGAKNAVAMSPSRGSAGHGATPTAQSQVDGRDGCQGGGMAGECFARMFLDGKL